MKSRLYLFLVFTVSLFTTALFSANPVVRSFVQTSSVYNNHKGLVQDCADPYILKHDGMYYLYGTGGNDGIKVYTSQDLAKWSTAKGASYGYALHKKDVWGEKWFWAPEVYHINNKFYMFYSAEERIAVAESDSPLGPFVQTPQNKKPFHANIPEIDTHLFIDDDGKMYLYFVRFTNGNEIWAAEINDDLQSIKESTLVHCVGAYQSWELSTREPFPRFKVNEGPFVLKHNDVYYLTYSANHYQNPNYGVGYATSDSPLGPWVKYRGNPILIGNDKIQGVGHHSFITASENCRYIVYHSHYTMTSVHPRKVGIDLYEFVSSGGNSPDILKIHGPTTTNQTICTPTYQDEIYFNKPTIMLETEGLYVKGDADLQVLNVYSVNGKILSSESFFNEIHVKLPSAGIYIVEVKSAEAIPYRQKIVIN